jgi:hypothetical protein
MAWALAQWCQKMDRQEPSKRKTPQSLLGKKSWFLHGGKTEATNLPYCGDSDRYDVLMRDEKEKGSIHHTTKISLILF